MNDHPPLNPFPEKDARTAKRQVRQKTEEAEPHDFRNKTLPDILLPYQKDIFLQLDLHDAVVVEKSRRTGFTWGVAARAVLYSAAAPASGAREETENAKGGGMGKNAGGMDSLYIGYNLEMAREFIDVCAMWAKAFAQVAEAVNECLFAETDENGEKRGIKAFRITFASGFEVVALSARPRSLRGKQGFVIIDEAAFHDDLPGLLKSAMALLMWGGKVMVISTHNGEDHPFNRLCDEVRTGRKKYGHIRVDFDRAVREGLFRRICLMRGQVWSQSGEDAWAAKIYAQYGRDAEEELRCLPRSLSTVDVFIAPAFVRAASARPLPEINAQALVLGVDVARFGDDASVVYPRRGADARSLPYLVCKGLSTTDFARRVFDYAMLHQPQGVFVDGGGVGGGVVDTLRDMGLSLVDVAFGGKSDNALCRNKRADMYHALRQWLKTGCLPDDEQLEKELSAARYFFSGPDIIQLEAKKDIKKRLGFSPDIADALALTFAFPVPAFDPAFERAEAMKQRNYDPRSTEYDDDGDYDPPAV